MNTENALIALDAWVRWCNRGPMYTPGPQDYSRPTPKSIADYVNTDQLWHSLVEGVLVEWNADGYSCPRHVLRRILRHRAAGRPAHEFTDWGFVMMDEKELWGVLGLIGKERPADRVEGDWQLFLDALVPLADAEMERIKEVEEMVKVVVDNQIVHPPEKIA